MIQFLLFAFILLVYSLVYNVIINPDFSAGLKKGLREYVILLAAAIAIAWIAVLFL